MTLAELNVMEKTVKAIVFRDTMTNKDCETSKLLSEYFEGHRKRNKKK